MKVLFLNPVGFAGGAEQVLLDMIASLRAYAPGLTLGLLTGTDGPLLNRAAAAGAVPLPLPMPAPLAALGDSGVRGKSLIAAALTLSAQSTRATPAAVRYVWELSRAIDAFAPDLLHSNGIKTHLLAAALPRKRPLVWHLHDFLSERPFAVRALRALAPRAALAIANSQAVADDSRPLLRRTPVEVLLNAVDTQRFSPAEAPPDASRLDALAGLPPAPPGTVRVGLVATYARWKGQDLFLESAARLRRRPLSRPVRFYLVGGPMYRTPHSQFSQAELRRMAAPLGLDGALGFVPFQEDVAAVYRMLDVVVHASTRREPFGLVIAEAMACGRAVVAAREGGTAELLEVARQADADSGEAGAVGIGVPPRQPDALAEAIAHLVERPERRAALGENAHRAASAWLSRDRLGPQLLQIYARLGVSNFGGVGPITRQE